MMFLLGAIAAIAILAGVLAFGVWYSDRSHLKKRLGYDSSGESYFGGGSDTCGDASDSGCGGGSD